MLIRHDTIPFRPTGLFTRLPTAYRFVSSAGKRFVPKNPGRTHPARPTGHRGAAAGYPRDKPGQSVSVSHVGIACTNEHMRRVVATRQGMVRLVGMLTDDRSKAGTPAEKDA